MVVETTDVHVYAHTLKRVRGRGRSRLLDTYSCLDYVCVRVQENTRVIRREPEWSARVRRPRESEPVGNVAEFHGVVCLVTLS